MSNPRLRALIYVVSAVIIAIVVSWTVLIALSAKEHCLFFGNSECRAWDKIYDHSR